MSKHARVFGAGDPFNFKSVASMVTTDNHSNKFFFFIFAPIPNFKA